MASNCYLGADGQPLSFWNYILVLNARTDGRTDSRLKSCAAITSHLCN